MKAIYKVITRDRTYVVENKENNVEKFIKDNFKPNTFSRHKLHIPGMYTDYGKDFNYVMINSNHVSSVQYYVEGDDSNESMLYRA